MEFLLQWLDELDDLASSALFIWHRISAASLVLGLGIALLIPAERFGWLVPVSPYMLAQAALACVLIWGVGGLLAVRFERRLSSRA